MNVLPQFHPTPAGKANSYRDGQERRGEAGAARSNHTAGVTIAPSDLICRQTWPLSPLETKGQQSCLWPPADFMAFGPQVCTRSLMPAARDLLHSHPTAPAPAGAQDLYWQPSQACEATQVQDFSLDSCSWTPLPCVHSGRAPFCCVLASHSSLASTAVHVSKGTLSSHGRAHRLPDPSGKKTGALVGLQKALASVTACTASPSCHALRIPGLVPVAGYHCAAAVVRSGSQGLHHDSQGTCSCQHACSWLQPFLSALSPTTTCVCLSTSPCHCTGPCSWGCAYHKLQPSLLPALVSGC